MYYSTRTIFSVMAQTEMAFGGNYVPDLNTTLNEKFRILSNEKDASKVSTVKYVTVGLHPVPVLSGSSVSIYNIKHSHKDGSLFRPLPIVFRVLADDLSPEERVNYRLRKTMNIGGVTYVAYYLKTLLEVEKPGTLVKITMEDEKSDLEVFDFNDPSVLTPIPEEHHIEDIVDKNVYLTYARKAKLGLSVSELNDMCKAIEILYPDEISFFLGELALCAGKDFLIGELVETIETQIHYFVDFEIDLKNYISKETPVNFEVDIGGMEPL